MTKEEAKQLLIKNFFTKTGLFSSAFKTQRKKALSQEWFKIIRQKFLDNILPSYPKDCDYDKIRIFLFLTDNEHVKELPKCIKCGKEASIQVFSKGFPKQCGDRNCQGKLDKIITGTINLNNYSYGYDNVKQDVKNVLDQICDRNGRIQSGKSRLFLEKQENIDIIKKLMIKYKITHINEIRPSTLTEIFYCIQNDITEQPLCYICNNPVNFISSKQGYSKTCSNKECQARYTLQKRIEKRKRGQTILIERTGKKKSWKRKIKEA